MSPYRINSQQQHDKECILQNHRLRETIVYFFACTTALDILTLRCSIPTANLLSPQLHTCKTKNVPKILILSWPTGVECWGRMGRVGGQRGWRWSRWTISLEDCNALPVLQVVCWRLWWGKEEREEICRRGVKIGMRSKTVLWNWWSRSQYVANQNTQNTIPIFMPNTSHASAQSSSYPPDSVLQSKALIQGSRQRKTLNCSRPDLKQWPLGF